MDFWTRKKSQTWPCDCPGHCSAFKLLRKHANNLSTSLQWEIVSRYIEKKAGCSNYENVSWATCLMANAPISFLIHQLVKRENLVVIFRHCEYNSNFSINFNGQSFRVKRKSTERRLFQYYLTELWFSLLSLVHLFYEFKFLKYRMYSVNTHGGGKRVASINVIHLIYGGICMAATFASRDSQI